MRDVTVELKALRLHGMAGAWCDLQEQGPASGLDSARWLVEHLLAAETTDRAMRSVQYQMTSLDIKMNHQSMSAKPQDGSDVGHGAIPYLCWVNSVGIRFFAASLVMFNQGTAQRKFHG